MIDRTGATSRCEVGRVDVPLQRFARRMPTRFPLPMNRRSRRNCSRVLMPIGLSVFPSVLLTNCFPADMSEICLFLETLHSCQSSIRDTKTVPSRGLPFYYPLFPWVENRPSIVDFCLVLIRIEQRPRFLSDYRWSASQAHAQMRAPFQLRSWRLVPRGSPVAGHQSGKMLAQTAAVIPETNDVDQCPRTHVRPAERPTKIPAGQPNPVAGVQSVELAMPPRVDHRVEYP